MKKLTRIANRGYRGRDKVRIRAYYIVKLVGDDPIFKEGLAAFSDTDDIPKTMSVIHLDRVFDSTADNALRYYKEKQQRKEKRK